jgi:hypothetical protein
MKKHITASELVHHFANKTFKTGNSGIYNYENDCFYSSTTCIARVISRRKKIVVINNNFDRTGAFGNGLSSRHLFNAFSDEWIKLEYKPFPTIKYNKQDIYKAVYNTVFNEVKDYIDLYVAQRELIINPRAYVLTHYQPLHQTTIDKIDTLCIKLGLSKKKVYGYIHNDIRYVYLRSLGFGKPVEERYKVDKPISFYLNPDSWFSDEHKLILQFKEWKAKYLPYYNSYIAGNKTMYQIWSDVDRRKSFEAHAKKVIRTREEKNIKDAKDAIEAFFNRKRSTIFGGVPILLRLNVDQVETSHGAIVPLHHAKRLYLFLKKCISNNSTYEATGKNEVDRVGYYTLRKINKEDDKWYILIGCHKIFETAINDFVERYKLDW